MQQVTGNKGQVGYDILRFSAMRLSEVTPCNTCYQAVPCEKYGNPITTSAAVEGGDDVPLLPPNCFYHCCRGGVKAAKVAYRKANADGSAGFIPFATEHKPFVERLGLSGRFVAIDAEALGFNNGDIVVRVQGEQAVATNVFDFHPPR